MELDRNGLEVLSREQALALLASVPVARVGLSMNALPAVLPVNFVLDGDEIIIRTAEGSKLDAALGHAVVALEADEFDPIGHVGWSVLVRGTSRVLAMPGEIEHARSLSLRPWANEDSDRFVAISTDLVSGRRIHPWYRAESASTARSRLSRSARR